jgi:L-glyceraldehyde reductase
VELSKEDYDEISRIVGKEGRKRFNIPYNYQPKWDINVFNEEEEKGAKHKVNIGI